MGNTTVLIDPTGKILSVRFEKKRPKWPKKVEQHLMKDFERSAEYNTWKKKPSIAIRHIISAEAIYSYWEKYLQGRTIYDAEKKLVKE